jgi:type IV pilus assembly protein PilF
MSIAPRSGAALLAAALAIACAGSGPREEVQGDEKAARINVQLGATYLDHGNLELANVKLERALQQDPELATAHWTYALLQSRLGRPKLAEKHFRRAIALDPEDSRAHNNYGTFLCNAGRLAEAQAQFDLAVENPLYDQPETALANAGVCALKAQDPEKAETYFRAALDKNPRFVPALAAMARLSFDQGQFEQTQGFLDRFEKIAGHNAGSLLLAVRTEAKLGDRDAASSYAMQLRNKYPESREAAELRKGIEGL